jgi:hypothetical protein
MLLPGELVCRTDGESADGAGSMYPILYQAIRLIDAISDNELCGLIDIDEDFIGVFLRYDAEYGDSHCHVLFNEEVLLVSNDYLMSYPNAPPILSSGSGQ